MRDIRSDLRERLEAFLKELRSHEDIVADLKRQAEGTRALLEAEERRWASNAEVSAEVRSLFRLGSSVTIEMNEPTRSLRDFTLSLLCDGKPWPLQKLRDRALNLGYLKKSTSPGRSMQGLLMSLLRSGLVAKQDDGDWIITEKGSAACEKESADPLVHHQ